MNRLRSRFVRALVVTGSFLLGTAAALAADSDAKRSVTTALFGGELGRWLEQQAIPELVTLVGQHPRFRGEQIRVVTMTDGLPTIAGSGLSHALRDRLTHQLTRVQGAQIAWQNQPSHCGPPRKSPYLLGVEISAESRSNALVTIAMVDVEEGIWVSGGYLQWRGALTQAERRALSLGVTSAPVGSIDSPLPGVERDQISKLLLRQIECSLRGGLEGSVQVSVANPDDELLEALALELREALAQSATLTLVGSSESGQDGAINQTEWQLELKTSSDVGESVVAMLRSKAAGDTQLAAVYVQRSVSGRVAGATQAPRERHSSGTKSPAPASVAALIEQLHEVPAEPGDQCFRRSAACLEVQLELAAPSYLFVLRTQPSGEMNLGSCNSPLARDKTRGTKRFRMQVRDSGAGFYALATQDIKLAGRLHRELAAGAENCGERARGDWLELLATTLAEADKSVDWQALHIPARRTVVPRTAVAGDTFGAGSGRKSVYEITER